MRKITLFMALILSTVLVYGQNSNVRKAESALENGELTEAMTLINEASKHEKTFDDGKTWYVRGTVYNAALKENYSDDLLKEAVLSFNKVFELEKENATYHTLAQLKIDEIWGTFLNRGSEAYGEDRFSDAVEAFKKALLVLPEDTTATLYAGIAAQQAKDNASALKFYYRLLDLDYNSEDIYGSIISIERYENKDIDKALEVIAMAKKDFPENSGFEKLEINLLISAERVGEAKDRLNEAIKKEPTNANLYFNLGYLNEVLGNPEEAKKAYLKAIELDPDYLDAISNYAIFNYNIAADMYSKTRDMDLKTYQKEGKKIEKEAASYLKESLPYFEKAYELSPDDRNIIETLQVVYSQLKMNEKSMEMLDKLDEIRAKNKAEGQ